MIKVGNALGWTIVFLMFALSASLMIWGIVTVWNLIV